MPITVSGETVTNAVIDLNGIVYLPRRGFGAGLYSMNGGGMTSAICTNALVLVPYLDDLYMTTNLPASKIMVGTSVVSIFQQIANVHNKLAVISGGNPD